MDMAYIMLILLIFSIWLTSRYVFQSFYDVLVKIGLGRKFSIKILAFIFLPGTIIHELSHMFMAESLRVRTGAFTVWPQEEGEHIKLGSVRVERTDPIRSFFIGIAPLLVGILVLLALVVAIYEILQLRLTFVYLAAAVILGSYVIFVTANTMFSSKKDIEACIEFIGIALVLIVLFYFIWDEQVPKLISFLMQGKIADSIVVMNKILAIPLGMNILIVVPRMLFRK